MPQPTDALYRRWREGTDLDPAGVRGRTLDWDRMPAPRKEYPEAPRRTLPGPSALRLPPTPLWRALADRRSRRDLEAAPIPPEHLAALLWACQGVTARQGPYLLRTAPSAGALFPFETYVSVQGVDGWEPCLTHFHVSSFSLEVLEPGDHGSRLARAALGQGFLARSAAVFLWTAVLPRCAWKYGDRALRYLGLDLGHVCQNLALAASALGLGCCPVAAFFDEEMNQVLGVDGADEFAYYLAAVGRVHTPPSVA
ncbi:MAG: SagB/ThcOx family dehydrogenase [Deferrisomatales bacterium]|nr:SagB/ThcOx family dehydrogenase [Deferrisomatales bacterium]